MDHLTKQDKQFLKEAVFRFELAKRETVIKLGDFENIDGDDYEHHENESHKNEDQKTLSSLDDYFDEFYSTHSRVLSESPAIAGEAAEDATTLLRNRLGTLGTVLTATEQLAADTRDKAGYYEAFVSTLSYTRHHSGISLSLVVIAILCCLFVTYAAWFIWLGVIFALTALALVFDKFRAINAAKKRIQNMQAEQ